MDLEKLLRVGICVAGLGIAVSACTPNAIETITATSTSSAEITTEQAVWKKITSDGDAAKAAGDLKKAEACYQAAIEEAKKLGETDPALGSTTANLADFYYAQGDGQQADKLYKQSLDLREKALGLEHADLVQSILGLARVNAAEKNYAESVAHYERALTILKKNNLPVTPEVEAEYAKAKESASTAKGSKAPDTETATKDSGAEKGSGKGSDKGASKDSAKETSKDSAKESSKESAKEASKESVKESSKESSKESAKSSSKG